MLTALREGEPVIAPSEDAAEAAPSEGRSQEGYQGCWLVVVPLVE
jgi:hypothetical protein